MNFQELGLILQREREKKGLSVEAVMEATKISKINLEALEKGDRSALPHPVYTKGFIKSYARLLGLDADELSMIVDREYQSDGLDDDTVSYDVSPMTEKAFHENEAPVTKKRSIWPSILVVVVLLAVIVVLVVRLNTKDEQKIVEPSVAPKVVETPVVPTQNNIEEEVQADLSATDIVEGEEEKDVEPEIAEPPVVSEPVAPVVEPKKPEAKTVKKVEKVAEKQQGEQPEKQKYDHVLIIRATTDKGCWIGVWKGDETVMARDFVLKEGEPLRLMFNNPRRIRIGNAAGVSVLYNGKPYPLNEAKGNIQTLRFGQD